ncbi:TonB-dependent receptor [Tsuneonella mangrovi]|uniref:TonB-dependent receptor n=1 Tax=Tsuneonella mangrovi TaxID=1982042 RepID=UPI000BA28929|nr:TonB-dependent receptor [Tsuneonella mangrovi]
MTIYHSAARVAFTSLLAATALASTAPAFAQDRSIPPPKKHEASKPAAPASDAPDDDYHSKEIVVTGAGLPKLDTLAGTSVVQGVALQRSLAGQIGEVLESQPGVSMSGFAPGASRPVLRGFSGSRVKLLIDGIGSIDASNVSDDHAVAIDPFNAERIDVLRGPAVLLYGSQAIGGAVNVIDKRIPNRLPDEPIHIDALLGAGNAADMRESALSLDAPIGGGFAAHLDGSYHRSGDVSVPGYTVAEPLRASLLAQADAAQATDPALAAALRGQADQSGSLPDSGTSTYDITGGIAFFQGDSNMGASLSYYDTYYGVPNRPGDVGGEPGHIGLRQWRGDLRADLALGDGLFSKLNSRVAFSHYTHSEYDGPNIGTTFNVEGLEARSELVEAERSGWSGSLGVQYTSRHLDTIGDPLLPRNLLSQFAVFAMQQVPLGGLQMQVAGRYEHASIAAPDIGEHKSYGSFSGALGLSYLVTDGLELGANLNRVARSPSPEELFIDGYHDATQTYERGDASLVPEKAVGGELFARGTIGEARVSLTGFYDHFQDYIYQYNTGLTIGGAPLYQFAQGDANYSGFEGEFDVPLVQSDSFALKAETRASYVRAKLTNDTNVPLIPPLSLFGALQADAGRVSLRGEVAWFGRQDKVAPNETPTDGYTFVNAELTWRPLQGDNNVTVLLKADNIFNVTGRLATSLTKDYTPQPGRDISASVRVSF